jgi:hypothetical protein
MANTFKNAKAVLKDSSTAPTGVTLYTCPSATIAIVVGAQITNVTSAPEEVTVWWVDASDSNAITRLVQDVIVPGQAALAPIAGKLVLEAGDSLVAQSEDDDDAEMTVSVLEIS